MLRLLLSLGLQQGLQLLQLPRKAGIIKDLAAVARAICMRQQHRL